MALKDVQNSLGFLALQAEAADEQRKQVQAFQREQQASESSAQGFDRMAQMLAVLDQRRQAKHDRDMEVAQLAGKAGVALSDEQGNEAKGRFAIGEALTAAEERKQREREEARLSLEAFQQSGQDRRAEEARKSAMERTDKYIAATNQRTTQNIGARMDAKNADIASREKIAEMKKPGKGGKKAGGEGAGAPLPDNAIPLDKTRRGKYTDKANAADDAIKALDPIIAQLTDDNVRELTNRWEKFKRGASNFATALPFAEHLISDDTRKENARIGALKQQLQVGVSEAVRRFGAALTPTERALALSLEPNDNDTPVDIGVKAKEARAFAKRIQTKYGDAARLGYTVLDDEEVPELGSAGAPPAQTENRLSRTVDGVTKFWDPEAGKWLDQ